MSETKFQVEDIERPKKKVTKTMYQVVSRYERREGCFMTMEMVQDTEEAMRKYGEQFIALGPAITFEVEE